MRLWGLAVAVTLVWAAGCSKTTPSAPTTTPTPSPTTTTTPSAAQPETQPAPAAAQSEEEESPVHEKLMEQLEKGSLKSEAQRKNPYPSTTATLASAGKNFMNLCAPCHGQMGRGDGPAGTALKPRPADLTIEARPSEHTDGMLLYIITHGVGQMPAFEKQLSEKQRWEMVNYLRTLAK